MLMTPRRLAAASPLSRRQVVWLSLTAAMTGVGALLLATENRPSPPPVLASLEALGAGDLGVIFSAVEGDPADWRGIVVHHSGGTRGSAASIDAEQQAQGLRGLGYHFVIGNGTGSPDGQVEVGFRWTSQLPGAHVQGPNADEYNRRAIGICLVGDGERQSFTDAQIASLIALIGELQSHLELPADALHLHRDIAPTVSPGRLFPEAAIRDRVAHLS